MTAQQAQADGSRPKVKAKAAKPKAPKPSRDPEGRMPLGEHIRELRTRLFRSSIAILLGGVVGWIVHNKIIDVLSNTVCNDMSIHGLAKGAGTSCANGVLTIEGATASIALAFKISLMVGLLLASPIWLYQLWAFIAPGLHKNEKRYGIGFVAAGVPLFFAGAALCYYILPTIMKVLTGFTSNKVGQQLHVDTFLGFVMRMILMFGASFEVPLLVVLLNMVGILSAKRLKATWRYVTFAIFVFAAAAVPTGEPIGMLALAAPMCALYYGAIGFAVLNDKRRAARNINAGLSPDEASSLDLTPAAIEAPAPVDPGPRNYDDVL